MTQETDKKLRTAFASTSGGFVSMPRLDQGPDTLRDLGALRRIDGTQRTEALTSTALRAR